MNENKQVFKWQTALLLLGFVFNLGANFSTQAILNILYTHNLSQSTALALEQNPVGRFLLQTPILSLVVGLVFYLIVWFGFFNPLKYMVIKKPNKQNKWNLNIFVLTLFFLLLLDCLNDLGYWLKLAGAG